MAHERVATDASCPPWAPIVADFVAELNAPRYNGLQTIDLVREWRWNKRNHAQPDVFSLPQEVRSLMRQAASEVHRLPWFTTPQPHLLDITRARSFDEAALRQFRVQHGLALPVELRKELETQPLGVRLRRKVHRLRPTKVRGIKEPSWWPEEAEDEDIALLAQWAGSGLAPCDIWVNLQAISMDTGTRGDLATEPVLLDWSLMQSPQWQNAKFVFLDCDGVCVKEDESLPELPQHLPDEQLLRLFTTPRYSSLALPRYRKYDRATVQLLREWQEEDPHIHFVMATHHLGHSDAASFRNVFMHPLRVVGGVSKRSWQGIVQWMRRFVWGEVGGGPSHTSRFVVLDDDKSYFEFWAQTRFAEEDGATAVFPRSALPAPLVHVTGGTRGLLSAVNIAQAKHQLGIEWRCSDAWSPRMWGSRKNNGGVHLQRTRDPPKAVEANVLAELPVPPWVPVAEKLRRELEAGPVISFAEVTRSGNSNDDIPGNIVARLPGPLLELLRKTVADVRSLPWFGKSVAHVLDVPTVRGELAEVGLHALLRFRLQHGLALAAESQHQVFSGLSDDAERLLRSVLSGALRRDPTFGERSRCLRNDGAIDAVCEDASIGTETKFAFLRDDAFLSRSSSSSPSQRTLPLHLPDEQLIKVVTTPCYSCEVLAEHVLFDRMKVQALQAWQEEDPRLCFVIAAEMLNRFDVDCFRELFLYPLRIVGSVRTPDLEAVVEWLQKFAPAAPPSIAAAPPSIAAAPASAADSAAPADAGPTSTLCFGSSDSSDSDSSEPPLEPLSVPPFVVLGDRRSGFFASEEDLWWWRRRAGPGLGELKPVVRDAGDEVQQVERARKVLNSPAWTAQRP